ncbi:unnamed protein product [Camellia sinensis]
MLHTITAKRHLAKLAKVNRHRSTHLCCRRRLAKLMIGERHWTAHLRRRTRSHHLQNPPIIRFPCVVQMASIRTSPRTQAKNKGISLEKSSSLIANEITKGNRPFLVLSQAGYKSLARKFEKKTGRQHGLKQLKNKYMSLKKEWNAWRKLMDSSRGVSGIDFDSKTGMFQASDEWWDKMESTNKACAKFKKKILEHRELMETVFTGASATGKHHWTPGEKFDEPADISSDFVDSLGAQPFVDPIPTRAQDVDSDSSLELVATVKEKRKRTPSSCGKSKKATTRAVVIAESMNNLTNMVRTQNQQVTVRHLIGNESLYTISECMHRLRNIPALLDTPLFHFSSTLIDNADYWEVMMC